MRAYKAILLFIPLLFLGVFFIYLGLLLGKVLIVFVVGGVGKALELAPVTDTTWSDFQILTAVFLILFGLLFAHLSAVRITGGPSRSARMIVKGIWSCLVAGMTVGTAFLLPLVRNPIAADLEEIIFGLGEYEIPVMFLGLGIMLYYFFRALPNK